VFYFAPPNATVACRIVSEWVCIFLITVVTTPGITGNVYPLTDSFAEHHYVVLLLNTWEITKCCNQQRPNPFPLFWAFWCGIHMQCQFV